MLIQLLALPWLYHETLTFKRSIQNDRHDVFKFTLITHVAKNIHTSLNSKYIF